MIQDPLPIAAGIVSTAFLLWFVWALRQPKNSNYVGPAADWIEIVRGVLLPLLDRHTPGIKWAYTLHDRERVGYIDAPPEEVEQLLWEHGFRRMPLAAYKDLIDGREEVGSWAFRESLTAEEQLHVMLFAEGDGTAVYAHSEKSAINPFTAWDHYRGIGYDIERGKAALKDKLPSGVWDAQ